MGKVVIGCFFTYGILMGANINETIFDGNCGSCHTLKDRSSAPLITEIVQKYKNKYPKEKEFVNALSNWVFSPNKKFSLFPKAVNYYGLMPELGMDKDTLIGIGKYLFERKF